MKHLSTSILGLLAIALLPGVCFAQSVPSFGNPTDLATKALTNPTGATTSVTNKLTDGTNANINATMKDIGAGYSVTSLGTIVKNGSLNPVALVDGNGNIVSATQNKLDNVAQGELNRLMKGVTLPAGFGSLDRTPTSFVQKNTYVAATDDPDVYYGSGNAAGGGVGFASGSVGSIVSAVVGAAGSSSAPAVHALPGSNQIVNASGVVVANYNPATGQFTSATGTTVSPDSADYAAYKAALAGAGTNTASNTTPPGNTIR